MLIIIGLGNPEGKYKHTRHNVGFQVIDRFARENNFPDFKLSKKYNSLISESVFENKKVLLAKPQTFMNESGKAIKLLTKFYKITNSELIIIHDDIDLPLSKIRISKNRGSAGHKGVESIIKELGNKNFFRFRIGIHPLKNKPQNTEKFVLQKFTPKEEKIIKNTGKEFFEFIKKITKQK